MKPARLKDQHQSGRVNLKQREESVRGERLQVGTEPQPELETVKVHFEYFDPSARTVYIAGGFNDWHPAASEMISLGAGRWAKELLLKPGTYEYRLVVDGVWKQDPGCAASTPNPFGDRNSIRVVEGAGKRLH